MTGEPGKFTFEPGAALPPMFQALPLQMSAAALIVEGTRRCWTCPGSRGMGPAHIRPPGRRGAAIPTEPASPTPTSRSIRCSTVHIRSWRSARQAGIELADAALTVRGLELAGLAERRTPIDRESILVLDDDPETVRG